jgi:hypothetical protein
LTTTNPKLPDGQAADRVAAADKHPEHRGATLLQQSTMPTPSRGWKPPSMTTPGPSSRRRKTTMGPKPPGGQAVAPVAAADMHPECRSGHPLSANPCQLTTTSGSSSEWKPKATDPKPPDGAAAAPVTDADMPPKWTLQVAPTPCDCQTRAGIPDARTCRGPEREVCGISHALVSQVETPREGGNVRGTPLDLSSFLFLTPFSLYSYSLTLPFYIFTGS